MPSFLIVKSLVFIRLDKPSRTALSTGFLWISEQKPVDNVDNYEEN